MTVCPNPNIEVFDTFNAQHMVDRYKVGGRPHARRSLKTLRRECRAAFLALVIAPSIQASQRLNFALAEYALRALNPRSRAAELADDVAAELLDLDMALVAGEWRDDMLLKPDEIDAPSTPAQRARFSRALAAAGIDLEERVWDALRAVQWYLDEYLSGTSIEFAIHIH